MFRQAKYQFTTLMNGKALQKELLLQIKNTINAYKLNIQNLPQLDVILVGNDPSSHLYVKKKQEFCKKLSIQSQIHLFSENTNILEILQLIEHLNSNQKTNAILLQLPLPYQMNPKPLIEKIHINKDVDCLHPENLGNSLLFNGSLTPCTAAGVIYLLEKYTIPIVGKKIVVIGRSQMVGLPIAMKLMSLNATVTIIHRQSQDYLSILKEADIIVSATGVLKVKREWIKKGAVVIDVGIRYENGKITGDVEDVIGQASYVTPVPGGVGPLTVAMLVRNVVHLWLKQHGIQDND